MTTNEEILRNRVKFIGDGEWTLLGTPAEVIAELDQLLQEEYKRGYNDAKAGYGTLEEYGTPGEFKLVDPREFTKQEEQ